MKKMRRNTFPIELSGALKSLRTAKHHRRLCSGAFNAASQTIAQLKKRRVKYLYFALGIY
ncbi:CLUMA_CG000785, isoform A [Clunio marinus]|uniref:CLUMA_CG000785, isoform A n=1 Tax=Clunio marinus TaxID=568069 RepID=A0A1J1HHT2_9DIPT|nr:CLUMA_CG000785, isoform A [Clunio marinus]